MTLYRDLVEVNRFIKKSEPKRKQEEEKRKQEEKGDVNQKEKDAEKKELEEDANYNINNHNIIIFLFSNPLLTSNTNIE